ncbi:MAG: cyclic nucleotide-binding domain-containing protein [Desulfobacteraceae bacterium]|nr:cyclic nucleotide-binding domain-containing protein [Desulfobacteraceae bacterium]
MLNKLDFLAKVPLFSLMKEMDLHRISLLARDDLFHKGEIIIREGDHDRRLFIIISGGVDVIKDLGGKNEKYMGTLGPYSYFGEMALIDDMVRSASVVAKGDTQLLSLDHWNLRQEIEKYPAMAIELLQMLSRRIRAIEKTLVNTLGTLLPLCSHCKKIREDNGSWVVLEEYIEDHSDAEFSHSICPECSEKLYPEFYKKT